MYAGDLHRRCVCGKSFDGLSSPRLVGWFLRCRAGRRRCFAAAAWGRLVPA